jgi:hypothetical protein
MQDMKDGLWRIEFVGLNLGTGAVADGLRQVTQPQTLCTKAETIKLWFDAQTLSNEVLYKGTCTTQLTTDTVNRGVAITTCPPIELANVPIPEVKVSVTIQKISNAWTTQTEAGGKKTEGGMKFTYLNGKSATCDPDKEQDVDQDESASNPSSPTTVGSRNIGTGGVLPGQVKPKDKPTVDDNEQNAECNGTYKGTYQGLLSGNLKVSIYEAPNKKRQFLHGTASSNLKDERLFPITGAVNERCEVTFKGIWKAWEFSPEKRHRDIYFKGSADGSEINGEYWLDEKRTGSSVGTFNGKRSK